MLQCFFRVESCVLGLRLLAVSYVGVGICWGWDCGSVLQYLGGCCWCGMLGWEYVDVGIILVLYSAWMGVFGAVICWGLRYVVVELCCELWSVQLRHDMLAAFMTRDP